LLSNAEKEQLIPQLHRQGLYNLFSAIGISSDFGIIKPDTRIYTQFVQQLGYAESECVMIDDNSENVDGAQRAGLHAIHFTSNAQLTDDLKRLLDD
jgi:HAD superfamily hydrolase (TIGR01509 family)